MTPARSSAAGRPGALEAALLDSAAVVAAWATMALAEALVVSLAWGQEFSAAWEIVQSRRLVVPMAVAGLAPVSLVVVGWWRVAGLAREGRRLAVAALGVAGAVAVGAVALGVSTGRHFASWGARGPFVAALVVAGAACGVLVAPRVAGLARRPAWLGALGAGVATAAWLADALVLRRLYPAFHLALLATSLVGGALAALAVRSASEGPSSRAGRVLGVVMGALVVGCAVLTPHAARELERLSNLRIILVEHAPILGRTVEAAEAVRPREASEDGASPGTLPSAEITRSLDWTGHDLVLITVDALRADHVSAYGYARATTPSLDALAREGTLFDAAYCPTPHTSYSITSMMTGKYLRPLLALGLGEDSETWAQDLRRYGWRTAAFYPPAVFFIDEDRFPRFEESRLGFEYAKVEFADPALREEQVRGYLDGAPSTAPLFLWVHFFEPHEPYVPHPGHVFTGGRSADEDAYDGEVAAADDGIGRIVRLVRARRPGAIVVVTADHGEEFGEHGGRYHGTTVYEEQVRVPLVVVGPGVRAGRPGADRRADHRSPPDHAVGAGHPATGAAPRAGPRARARGGCPGPRRRARLRRDRRLRAGGLGPRSARVRASRRRLRPVPAGGRPRRATRPVAGRAARASTSSAGPCAPSSATTVATRAAAGRRGPRRCAAGCRATRRRRGTSRRCSTTPTWSSGARRRRSASRCTSRRRPRSSAARSPARRTTPRGAGPPWRSRVPPPTRRRRWRRGC